MTVDRWILLGLAIMTALQTLALRAVVVGRWAQKVENPTWIIKLESAVERLSEQIKDLRDLFNGRYTSLESRQLADHSLLRDVEREFHTWQAEVKVTLTERQKEYETTRGEIRADVEALKALGFSRRATDPTE